MSAYRKSVDPSLVLYVCTAKHVVCIDRRTGDERWRTKLDASFGATHNALLAYGDRLFAATEGVVVCLRASDGELLWSEVHAARGGLTLRLDPAMQPPLLLLAGDGSLCGIDALTGARRWDNGLSGLGFFPVSLEAPGTLGSETADSSAGTLASGGLPGAT